MDLSINPINILITIVSLLIAITLHEMAHAFTGLQLGDTTAKEQGRISFNPLDHIDPLLTIVLPIVTLVLFQFPILAAKPVPFNPARVKYDEFGAALIAAAGPLTNLLLAALGAVLMHAFNAGTGSAVGIFTVINVALFVFNMVPIPPLDGSRILYAFSPDAVRGVLEQLEVYGFFLLFGLILLVPAFNVLLGNINQAILNFLV